MKGVIIFIICVLPAQLAIAQQLLVLKSSKRLVIKVHQASGSSVYYSEWPDTSREDVKAVFQEDIQSLTLIQPSTLDSILGIVVAENNLKAQRAAQEQEKKWWNKKMIYYKPKISYGKNDNLRQYGVSFEIGIEDRNRYRIGFGTGVERINTSNLYGIQLPFFLSGNYIISKAKNENQIYALTNIGYSTVLNGDAVFGNNKLFMLGIGFYVNDDVIIEVYYKMQRANTTYQRNGLADHPGMSLGLIL